tara:strand:+ start:237 stop:500 length:264 start_codon:yes stop_codon:yes gene_type:complete
LIKKNLHSYIFKQNYDSEEYILEESNEVLLLGNPRYVKGEKKAYRIVWLDKVSNLFTITTLIEPRMSGEYSGGVWGYAVGSCKKTTR